MCFSSQCNVMIKFRYRAREMRDPIVGAFALMLATAISSALGAEPQLIKSDGLLESASLVGIARLACDSERMADRCVVNLEFACKKGGGRVFDVFALGKDSCVKILVFDVRSKYVGELTLNTDSGQSPEDMLMGPGQVVGLRCVLEMPSGSSQRTAQGRGVRWDFGEGAFWLQGVYFDDFLYGRSGNGADRRELFRSNPVRIIAGKDADE